MAFAKHVFGEDPQGKPDYEYIPSAVFSSPPIANVGLSEEEAVEQYKNVDVFTSSYKYAPISLPEPDLAGIVAETQRWMSMASLRAPDKALVLLSRESLQLQLTVLRIFPNSVISRVLLADRDSFEAPSPETKHVLNYS